MNQDTRGGCSCKILVYLPATELLRLFRTRRLSPVELMAAVIERAEAVEPRINAFAERLFDEALEQARAAETCYAGDGAPPRALEGLPVAIKEEHLVRRSVLAPAVVKESDLTGFPKPVRSSYPIAPARSAT